MVVLAQEESRTLKHIIGTEHILLGLVRENEGVATRILLDFDADAEKIRNEVIRQLPGASSTIIGEQPTQQPGLSLLWLDGLEPVLDGLAAEIPEKLGRDPDAGDLLLALACAPDTLPAQALRELGVDLDALWGTIERVREQTTRAREQARRDRQQLTEQIRELRVAKQQAIETGTFERAAELRDQERQLVEEHVSRRHSKQPQNEALHEIRRRLGIPRTVGRRPNRRPGRRQREV